MKNTLKKNDIKKAIRNMVLDKEEYEAWEIDNKICNYYELDNEMFEELTENSHQFEYISDVYELIDDLMIERGYSSENMCLYKKVK